MHCRLYFVKGECPEEACAIQVDCRLTSLRSRGCFILMAGNKSVVWMGRGVPEHKKAVVEALKQKWPELKQSSMIQEIEGQESSDLFKNALKSGNFEAELRSPTASMRLYHMNSVSGEFCVDEIVCPYLNQDIPNVLSFNQNDLYKVEQPGNLLQCFKISKKCLIMTLSILRIFSTKIISKIFHLKFQESSYYVADF